MEMLRRHISSQPTRLAAYLALECAIMRRYLARGGTVEDFCERLAPVFRRRFAAFLAQQSLPPHTLLQPASLRLRQEHRPRPHRAR